MRELHLLIGVYMNVFNGSIYIETAQILAISVRLATLISCVVIFFKRQINKWAFGSCIRFRFDYFIQSNSSRCVCVAVSYFAVLHIIPKFAKIFKNTSSNDKIENVIFCADDACVPYNSHNNKLFFVRSDKLYLSFYDNAFME